MKKTLSRIFSFMTILMLVFTITACSNNGTPDGAANTFMKTVNERNGDGISTILKKSAKTSYDNVVNSDAYKNNISKLDKDVQKNFKFFLAISFMSGLMSESDINAILPTLTAENTQEMMKALEENNFKIKKIKEVKTEGDKATATLELEQSQNGQKNNEEGKVEFIKEDGKWVVNSLLN